VLAPGRASRPDQLTVPGDGPGVAFEASTGARGAREGGTNPAPDCPLCEGHEQETPPETYALRPGGGPPDTPGWLVRVVPNKFPVLAPEGGHLPPDPLGEGRGEVSFFVSGTPEGTHEVIVHSPRHALSLAELEPEEVELVLETWRNRLEASAAAGCNHLIVNEGRAAGASLEHTHAQLYGLPFVPVIVARERERFAAHNTRTMGGCLLCDLLQEEVRLRRRVVAIDDHAVLLAPFASRSPFELQLVPRAHSPSIVDAPALPSALLREALLWLRAVLGGPPPFNLWVRTAPRGAEHFHWRIDIVPRMTQLAGLELGTGIGVNVYPPERAAEDLRQASTGA
jgi:UDPglucose--hexose-1-phosphate uridylyltransferase